MKILLAKKPMSLNKILFCLMLVLVSTGNSLSKNTLTRTVTDQDDQPVIGVNDLVKENNQDTTFDFEGRFELVEVNPNATLIFSYIGYQTLKVPLVGRSEVAVQLTSDFELLDEVAVAGYGTQKKTDLTGLVIQISGQMIGNQHSANIASLLNCRSAGVQEIKNSGTSRGELNIRTRGKISINSGNDPLYVVDGVPIGMTLNPVKVLKDALATAIYGPWASNGIIIITTNYLYIKET